MPKNRLRPKAAKPARRRREFASTALAAGITGLAIVGVVAATAALVAIANRTAAAAFFGAAVVATAWTLSSFRRQQVSQPRRAAGRSRTQDCRQARWVPHVRVVGEPHPPTEAERRVRPCPGSHHRGGASQV